MVQINSFSLKTILQFLIFFLFFLVACEKEPSEIGLNFKAHEKLNIYYTDTLTISALTYSMDSTRSDETPYSLTGTIDDMVFGTSEASFVAQVRLPEAFHPGENIVVDSLILFLLTDSLYVYGDQLTQLNLKVYELEKRLYLDSTYYSNLDVSDSISTDVKGSQNFFVTDSIVKIYLDNSLGDKIMSDTSALASQEDFLNHFKGFYIDAKEIVSGDGVIASFNLLDFRSRLFIYYSNSEEDSLSFSFIFNDFSARVNLFEHDKSTANPSYKINHIDDDIQDTVIYIQGMGGVYSKIILPYLKNWVDSMPMAINKAEFILPLSVDDPEALNAPPPRNFDLLYRNEEGDLDVIFDSFYSTDYFGGVLEEDDEFVRFTITSHVQDYLEELSRGDTLGSISTKNEFYLLVRNPGFVSNRSILTSPAKVLNKLRFKLTYTKIKE